MKIKATSFCITLTKNKPNMSSPFLLCLLSVPDKRLCLVFLNSTENMAWGSDGGFFIEILTGEEVALFIPIDLV